MMSMCRVFSCVVGNGCLLWPVCSLGKILLTFVLLHFAVQGQICLLLWQNSKYCYSDKTWSNGERNGKPLQYPCLENTMNRMKRQKDVTLKDELPRSVGAQYATGDQWRNNSRKNERMEPKQKQHPVVDMSGDGSKVWCCKEQYCIGTWNVRSTNQDKLEVIKQEMGRVKINILATVN